MRRVLTAAVTTTALSTMLLAGCSEQNEVEVPRIDLSEVQLPEVDWEQYAPDLREEVEGLVENADCAGLRRQLEGAEGDLRRYLQAALDEAGC